MTLAEPLSDAAAEPPVPDGRPAAGPLPAAVAALRPGPATHRAARRSPGIGAEIALPSRPGPAGSGAPGSLRPWAAVIPDRHRAVAGDRLAPPPVTESPSCFAGGAPPRPGPAVSTKSLVPGRAPEVKAVPSVVVSHGTKGTLAGYASLFGVVDLGRDAVMPGAFRASLARRGARGVKMLFQHDPAQPIGVWEEIAEDRQGLRVRGRLNLEVARARELHALLKQGAFDGLSIGFKAGRARRDPQTGVRRIAELDLWEVSLVVFPMLPGARLHALDAAASRA